MKLSFEDRSFIELVKKDNGMILISLGSSKKENGKNILSVSSAEISKDKFLEMVKSLDENSSSE